MVFYCVEFVKWDDRGTWGGQWLVERWKWAVIGSVEGHKCSRSLWKMNGWKYTERGKVYQISIQMSRVVRYWMRLIKWVFKGNTERRIAWQGVEY